MIYCILGYTATGKDTIVKELMKITKNRLEKAVSYTTRPMRKGEKDGSTYNFVNKYFFEKEKDNFIEMRKYKVWDGSEWYYGYHKNSFKDPCTDYICIIESRGYHELTKYFDNSQILAFYINTPEKEIKQRLLKRGDDPQEIERRLKTDKEDFADFLKNEKYIKIDNIENELTPRNIAYMIDLIISTKNEL